MHRSDPTDYMLADNLGYQLRLTSSLLRRGYRQTLQRAGVEASPEQITLLTLLDRGDEWTPGDMAAANGHDKAAVTRMLQAMQESGWVRAEPHPDNASRKRVRITAAGRRLLVHVDALTRTKERHLETHLSPTERATLMRSLAKLRRGVEGDTE